MRKLVMIACLLSSYQVSQAQAPVRSPVQDLLKAALGAINDLRFADADSLTLTVLAYPQLRRSDRIQALQLAAGALFPENEAAQKRDRAVAVLSQLVRLAPTAGLPREVTWPGLNDLYKSVAGSVFGASVVVREKNVVTGPSEAAQFDVVATRPAKFTLSVLRVGGNPVLVDSLHSQRGTLRLPVLVNERPNLASGDYEFTITAIDEALADTIVVRYDGTVQAPALELLPEPAEIDSHLFLPEKTRPRRVEGIISGILVAGGTILGARLLRSDDLKSVKSDGRAVPLGIVFGGISAGGVWLLDHGQAIPKNIAANRAKVDAHNTDVANTRATNQERVRTYKAEITINPEPR